MRTSTGATRRRLDEIRHRRELSALIADSKTPGDEDFRYVSSHDLRRRFAQRLLFDRQMTPRVVMRVGGWSSFQAIEPYLNAPTPEVVNAAFEEVGSA